MIHTESEAASLLRVSRDTIRRERLQGKIAFCRIGQRRVGYTDAQIAAYIEAVTCDSDNSGSHNGAAPLYGVSHGLTRKPGKRSDDLRAIEILSQRKPPLPSTTSSSGS